MNSGSDMRQEDLRRMPPPLYGFVLMPRRQDAGPGMNGAPGVPEYVARLYSLLDAHCEFVFLSGTRHTDSRPEPVPFPLILSPEPGAGALRNILLAMRVCPEAAWLVAGGAMSRLNARTIAHLIVNRNPDKWATAYVKPSNDTPEGLCAIYEPRAYPTLTQLAGRGCSSPDDALAQIAEHVELLTPLEPDALTLNE